MGFETLSVATNQLNVVYLLPRTFQAMTQLCYGKSSRYGWVVTKRSCYMNLANVPCTANMGFKAVCSAGICYHGEEINQGTALKSSQSSCHLRSLNLRASSRSSTTEIKQDRPLTWRDETMHPWRWVTRMHRWSVDDLRHAHPRSYLELIVRITLALYLPNKSKAYISTDLQLHKPLKLYRNWFLKRKLIQVYERCSRLRRRHTHVLHRFRLMDKNKDSVAKMPYCFIGSKTQKDELWKVLTESWVCTGW
jgi:hypothetical protein